MNILTSVTRKSLLTYSPLQNDTEMRCLPFIYPFFFMQDNIIYDYLISV